ncbi:MAG: hypothetical protein HC816_06450 [Leptolyngbyaceae cyanobacterium RM1_1_2]|nr:hypothetical protein [Leptolyngbyaceae cyanobacterium RM1_1_2]
MLQTREYWRSLPRKALFIKQQAMALYSIYGGLAATAIALLFVPAAIAQTPPAEFIASRDCAASLTQTISDIKAGRSVTVLPTNYDLAAWGYADGYPDTADQAVILRLSGAAAASVMSSPVLMNTLSDRLMADCAPVSLVIFQLEQPFAEVMYGRVGDRIVPFTCIDTATRTYPAWGESVCLE